ncbi:anaphase promoting complex subunit 5 ida [Arctopsyche grandis]|uniref:anaphase promoting complex subunit 5 ida n=1 Tax=Arctopsyche grandis TaxID=121162 RepID=UPI00406DA1FA
MALPVRRVQLAQTQNNDMENVTSHKIAVVVFIREFCVLKQGPIQCEMPPKYRKDFCMLVLKLIQCPDLEFKDLVAIFTSGKFNILDNHFENFCNRLKQIYDEGINALMDCISDAVEKLMIDQETNQCIISKSSVLGLYLRRMMLYLDKLSFYQVTSVYKSFSRYYEKGRPGSLIRHLSKDKLDTTDGISDYPMKGEEKKLPPPIEIPRKKIVFDKDREFERCHWSRRQAELFTAQQAALLQSSEPRAMSPPRLQQTIGEIIRDNPDYADAHFLSYLNCLREREFCGAVDSLYGCFDRSAGCPKTVSANTSAADRNRGFRYASLNLAVLHAQFGHKDQALIALKEAMVMSQEAGDNLCLQQAAGWLQCISGIGHCPIPTPRTPRPSAHCAKHRAALAAQAYVQHAVSRKVTPSNLFNLLMKGDVIHCQHSMADLIQISLVNRAVLWALYGKTEMASICCQLLLNLNTAGEWESEAACLATCGTAQMLAIQGQRTSAAAVLQHARARAPRPPYCLLWMRTQHIITANYSLISGKWQEAEQAANQLASIDRWESQLIKAELHFMKGEPVYAITCLNDILDNCHSNEESQLFLTLRIRAMILAAQIENSCSGIHHVSSTNITRLNEALSMAVSSYLYYLAAVIEMHVANVQLQLGCMTNALTIVQRVLATIMAHGGPFDQGRAMLLYVKCRIASAPKTGERRNQVLTLCTDLLENVKLNFNRVEAFSRIKDVIYLQAQLYHEIGNIVERNKRALEYRQMDEQYPTKLTNSLLTCF